MGRNPIDLAIGIGLIVIGILLVLGKLGLGAVLPYLGVVLIVVGVLILFGMLPAGTLIGIATLVVGILLVIGFLDLPRDIARYMWVINLVAGIVLIVLGVQKLARG